MDTEGQCRLCSRDAEIFTNNGDFCRGHALEIAFNCRNLPKKELIRWIEKHGDLCDL